MRPHSTLLGTAIATLGGVTCAGAWAASLPASAAPDADVQAPVMQALMLAGASETPAVITIEGTRWRKAPKKLQNSTGRAGSRIIVDGELWMRADDPAFEEQVRLGAALAAPESDSGPDSGADARTRSAPASTAAAEPRPETPAELRARQRPLLADARRRAAERDAERTARGAGALDPALARGGAAQGRIDDPGLARRSDAARLDRELAEAAARDAAAADLVAEQAAGEAAYVQSATVSALRLPTGESGKGDAFSYLQLMPISYDIGGGGIMLEGSTDVRERVHLLLRAGIAERYQEVLVGAGVHYTPPSADRLTLMLNAGLEYGVFPLENTATGLEVDDASSGPFVSAAGRLVLNPRFMIEGGVGYSSFHEGDPIGFGSGFFHVNEMLDLMSRIELGDQDSYGIGIRVNY